MLENTEIVRKGAQQTLGAVHTSILTEELLDSLERAITFKPTTKENLVLFAVPKLYRKDQNIKDELCKKT